MHTTFMLFHLPRSTRLRRALDTLALEVRTLLAALASPNRLIDEVKAMQALMQQAQRIEATEPARAAALRQRAARIGL
jgi:hypothetical protein